uniref:Transcriptional regulator n=1 Tax=Steinernema glaseri TaxID=37863 RepID=A0A1I7Y138_9BILA
MLKVSDVMNSFRAQLSRRHKEGNARAIGSLEEDIRCLNGYPLSTDIQAHDITLWLIHVSSMKAVYET